MCRQFPATPAEACSCHAVTCPKSSFSRPCSKFNSSKTPLLSHRKKVQTFLSKQGGPPDPRLGGESVQPEPGELTVAPSWPLSIRDTGAPPPPSPTDFKGVSWGLGIPTHLPPLPPPHRAGASEPGAAQICRSAGGTAFLSGRRDLHYSQFFGRCPPQPWEFLRALLCPPCSTSYPGHFSSHNPWGGFRKHLPGKEWQCWGIGKAPTSMPKAF